MKPLVPRWTCLVALAGLFLTACTTGPPEAQTTSLTIHDRALIACDAYGLNYTILRTAVMRGMAPVETVQPIVPLTEEVKPLCLPEPSETITVAELETIERGVMTLLSIKNEIFSDGESS